MTVGFSRSRVFQLLVTPDLFRGPPRGKVQPVQQERQPCVYILASAFNGTLYAGVTSNLLARIVQHRDEMFDSFTKRHGIKRLVYFDMIGTMDVAIAREKQLKRYVRDWKRNLIERDNPHWNDLAVGFGLPPLQTPPG